MVHLGSGVSYILRGVSPSRANGKWNILVVVSYIFEVVDLGSGVSWYRVATVSRID